MHLRIYLWLSCVLLAGYVRATELQDSVADETTIKAVRVQNDSPASADPDLFVDDADDGSGIDPDESSGSGWGAGPGVDDEDARGSGDSPDGLDDDEDYSPRILSHPVTPTVDEKEIDPDTIDQITDFTVVHETPEHPEPELPSAPEITPSNVDVIPKIETKNSDEEQVVNGRTGQGVEQSPRPGETGDILVSGEDFSPEDREPSGSNQNSESRPPDGVSIMNKSEDRPTSFFAQPGILAAVIGGAVVGLLCAILVVMFIVYRMRKKDEGSYALDEPKRSPAAASYGKGHNNREFYA